MLVDSPAIVPGVVCERADAFFGGIPTVARYGLRDNRIVTLRLPSIQSGGVGGSLEVHWRSIGSNIEVDVAPYIDCYLESQYLDSS